MSQTAEVRKAALARGFDAVGICDLRDVERDALDTWLARGFAGSMRYMNRQLAKRQHPSQIVPQATRAVVLLKNYGTDGHDKQNDSSGNYRVARYARGLDYHQILATMLSDLADDLLAMGSSRASTRWYVDAGPVPEREFASRAGLGWIAKNTMLINPKLGSYTFIGTVFTDLNLDISTPFEADRCGSCRRCLDACPTDAFPSDHVLDATRCISYLTIEYRGPFTEGQGPMIQDWLLGCDVCQEVCPWNVKFATAASEPGFAPRPEVVSEDLEVLRVIEDDEFDRRYGGTAFKRPGAAGIRRNAQQLAQNRSR